MQEAYRPRSKSHNKGSGTRDHRVPHDLRLTGTTVKHDFPHPSDVGGNKSMCAFCLKVSCLTMILGLLPLQGFTQQGWTEIQRWAPT